MTLVVFVLLGALLAGCGVAQSVREAERSVVAVLKEAAEAPPTTDVDVPAGAALAREDDTVAIVRQGAAVAVSVARLVGTVKRRISGPGPAPAPTPAAEQLATAAATTDPPITAAPPRGRSWWPVAGCGGVALVAALVMHRVLRRRL